MSIQIIIEILSLLKCIQFMSSNNKKIKKCNKFNSIIILMKKRTHYFSEMLNLY